MATYKLEILIEGKDRASAALGTFQRALSGVAQVASGFLAAQVITRIAESIASIPAAAVGAYTFFERLSFSLQQLAAREALNTGQAKTMAEALALSGDKAAKLLEWTRQLAIKSPFTTASVANAFRTAQAYGFTSDEAKRLTTALVDTAAGAGLTEEKVGLIAIALGQIKARGKLAAQEINQLADAGVPVREILAKAFGVTVADIVKMGEEGKLLASETIPLIVQAMEQDFGGAAARQTKTFSGLISTLSDIKQIGLKEFFTGTFQAIQPYLDAFVTKLSSPEAFMRMRELGDTLGGYVSGALQVTAGFVRSLADEWVFVRDAVLTFVQALSGEWTSGEQIRPLHRIIGEIGLVLRDVLGAALTFVMEHWEAFKGAALAVGAVLAGNAVAGAIGVVVGLLGTLLSPIGLAMGAVALLGAAWGENWGGIREKTAAVVDWLRVNVWGWLQDTAFPWVINDGLPALRGAWEAVWPVMQAAVATVYEFLSGTVWPWLRDTAFPWLKDTGLPSLQIAFEAVWSLIQAAVSTVYAFFRDVIWPWLEMAFGNLREHILPDLKAAFEEIWPKIMAAVAAVFTWLKDTFLPWLRDTAFPWIKDTFLPLLDQGFELTWAAITTAVRGTYIFLKDTVWPWLRDTAWPWLKDVALPALQGAFETIWNAIKAAVNTTFVFLRDTVWPWLRDTAFPWLKDTALPAMQTAFETVWNAISTAVSTVYTFFKDTVWPWLSENFVKLRDWLGEVETKFNESWPIIKGAVETAYLFFKDTVWPWLSTAFTNLKIWIGEVKTRWDADIASIKSFVQGLQEKVDAVKTNVGLAIDGIKGFFTNGWDAVKSTVQGVWSTIGGYISGPIENAQGVVDRVIGAIKGTIQGAIDLVNGLIRAINSIPAVPNIPSIPSLPSGGGSGFGGFRADGGPVARGLAYIVGERGPELFVPERSGTIVANGGRSGDGIRVDNLTIMQQPGEDPEELAQRFFRQLRREQQLAGAR